MAQIVTKYLGYFGKKFGHFELSKIAQSGHTGLSRINEHRESSVKFNTRIVEIFWLL